MPKGKKPSDTYSVNKSFRCDEETWLLLVDLRRRTGQTFTALIIRAIRCLWEQVAGEVVK